MIDDHEGYAYMYDGPPGDEGHWLIYEDSNGHYLLSPKAFEDWYLYAKDDSDGTARGWQGNPGPQGHFILTPNPDEECYLISTVKWQNYYLYADDGGTGYV